jgi:hypothetical protein
MKQKRQESPEYILKFLLGYEGEFLRDNYDKAQIEQGLSKLEKQLQKRNEIITSNINIECDKSRLQDYKQELKELNEYPFLLKASEAISLAKKLPQTNYSNINEIVHLLESIQRAKTKPKKIQQTIKNLEDDLEIRQNPDLNENGIVLAIGNVLSSMGINTKTEIKRNFDYINLEKLEPVIAKYLSIRKDLVTHDSREATEAIKDLYEKIKTYDGTTPKIKLEGNQINLYIQLSLLKTIDPKRTHGEGKVMLPILQKVSRGILEHKGIEQTGFVGLYQSIQSFGYHREFTEQVQKAAQRMLKANL